MEAENMSRNEEAYPRECVEAEQLVRSTIMRIINEKPEAGERERRMEFIAATRNDPELRNACVYVAFLSAWEDITSP
jgi:hypothetical protein